MNSPIYRERGVIKQVSTRSKSKYGLVELTYDSSVSDRFSKKFDSERYPNLKKDVDDNK